MSVKKPKRLLVVLQNPYNKGQLADWNPGHWYREFLSSRTGRRLARALPEERSDHYGTGNKQLWSIHFTNANPKVGDGPDAQHEPDLPHLRRTLRRVRPTLILTCGMNAEQAIVQLWDGPLIAIPHPAYRLLTNDLLARCKQFIEDWGVLAGEPEWRRKWSEEQRQKFGEGRRYVKGVDWEVEVEATLETPRVALRQHRGSSSLDPLEGK